MEDKLKMNFRKNKFKKLVLNWVCSMQTGPTTFRMNKKSDTTLFTSCFALFIFNLFDETSALSQKESNLWIDYINSFQDKDTGYFLSENYSGELNSKPVHQLTAFCLSALDILGGGPKYELEFVKQWIHTDKLYEYLKRHGCFSGVPGSGNMAMFVAIFLTYRYERQNDENAFNRMNEWFDFHKESQNELTGFWGDSLSKRYYSGFQNAFHQFEIYSYWDRNIPFSKKIVDTVLSLQDNEAHFTPTPGGGGCFDYDAAATLIKCGYKKEYRCQDIKVALEQLLEAILINQNADGGFCESRKRLNKMSDVFRPRNMSFIFSGTLPYVWYFRLRKTIGNSRKSRDEIITHWTQKGRMWEQSDLWNTWFRCLTIATIETIINPSTSDWKFQKFIGLGFFKKPDYFEN